MSYTQSRVIQLVGPRGSGKSLCLAKLGAIDLMRGKPVWSNMPVELSKRTVKWYEGKQVLNTIPLDWDAFYSLSQDLVEGTVLIDEAQYFSDARSSLSLKNRLLNAIVAQVRKRSLNLYYTVKERDWVDKRLNYETDIVITCFDLAWMPKKKNKRKYAHGERIYTCHYDVSGAIRGRPGRLLGRYVVPGRQWWNVYDTKSVIDLEEAFTSVKLDLQKRVITNKPRSSDIMQAIDDVASHLASKGTTRMPVQDFVSLFGTMTGYTYGAQHLGKFLPETVRRGRERGGEYFYDFSRLGT